MSSNEKIKKASQYCEDNSEYSLVCRRGKKPMLVRDLTGSVVTTLPRE